MIEENKPYEFQAGDEVDWNGMTGVVKYTKYLDQYDKYPIMVYFENESLHRNFTLDGRYLEGQDISLKLISQAKKKVKKKLYAYLYYNESFGSYYLEFFKEENPEIINQEIYIRFPRMDSEIEVEK